MTDSPKPPGPAGTPWCPWCPSCGRDYTDANLGASGCEPGRCVHQPRTDEESVVQRRLVDWRRRGLLDKPPAPAAPVEEPPQNAHPGKRGFCTHGIALNAPCVACHVENQREPDMARIYPDARNYTPSAAMEAARNAAAPVEAPVDIASRPELGAPTPVEHPPPWRWDGHDLRDANGALLINDCWTKGKRASPRVRALTEAAPEMEALLRRVLDEVDEYRGEVRALLARIDAAGKAGR